LKKENLMQKKLLTMAVGAALAAPASVALAQSSVQLYGTLNFSIAHTRYSASAGGVSGISKWAVNTHGSNYGIRGTENLGGGLTAWFQSEFNLKNERENDVVSGQGTARNSGLGLRGGWGDFFVGTWTTPMAELYGLGDVGSIGGYGLTTAVIGRRETTGTLVSRNCGNIVGAGGAGALTTASVPTSICGASEAGWAGAYAHWRRFGQALHYRSPMFGGAQFKLAITPNETKANGGFAPDGLTTTVVENPSAWSASLHWTGMGGKARIGIANMRAKDASTVGQTDSGWNIAGGYDFGVVNLGLVYDRYSYKTATGTSKSREYSIGAAIPVGSGKVGISYARARDIRGGALAGDNGAKQWNIGYEHNLSKRTAVNIGYAKISNDAAAVFTWTGMTTIQNGATATPLAGSDPSVLFVGMRHSF
jgi:predicted porin